MYQDHDTIQYFKSLPVFSHTAMQVPCSLVAKRLEEYHSIATASPVSPEREAVSFYLMNHAWAEYQMGVGNTTPFQSKIPELYAKTLAEAYVRLFSYMVLIITREARHVYGSATSDTKWAKQYGQVFVDFLRSLPSSSSGAAEKFRTSPPNMDFATYVKGITAVFNEGKFSGGYGGKPWGLIAETLYKCVSGETTPEIMVDTAFTLAHNNGPMFNKGMHYKMYTSAFKKILDIQRSGQIPQYVAENKVSYGLPLLAACQESLPDIAGAGYVDWYHVEAMGALSSCSSEQQAQVAKYGHPPKLAEAQAKAAAAEAAKFYISNSEYAVIYQRAA